MVGTNTGSGQKAGLREQKKTVTRQQIQGAALALFGENGFDATSVADVAAAAGVSAMTFYRYFPTKESVVLDDDYDPLIADMIAAQPRSLPPVERVRRALSSGLGAVFESDEETIRVRVRLILATPALRASFFDQFVTLEGLIAEALTRRPRARKPAEPTLATRVVASACAATMTTAVLYWGERGFVEPFPRVLGRAFDALAEEVRGR
jgi:AcrR family transcriptional regulator